MEYSKVKISDPIAKDFELENETTLNKYLDLPFSHWSSGSGDSAMWKNDSDGLLFFKFDTNSYFVMELSSYLSPIQNQDDIKWMEHHVGGNPFHFSSRFVCTKKTLLLILMEYSKSGKKHKDFNWTDPLPDEELFLKFQEQNNKTD